MINTKSCYLGLDINQWSLIADQALLRGRTLPDPSDHLALDLLLTWFHDTAGVVTPTPYVIIGVDVLGRELPARQPSQQARSFAIRVMHAGAKTMWRAA